MDPSKPFCSVQPGKRPPALRAESRKHFDDNVAKSDALLCGSYTYLHDAYVRANAEALAKMYVSTDNKKVFYGAYDDVKILFDGMYPWCIPADQVDAAKKPARDAVRDSCLVSLRPSDSSDGAAFMEPTKRKLVVAARSS